VSSIVQDRAGYLDLEEAVLLPEREELQLFNLNFTFIVGIKTVVANPVLISNNLNISVMSKGSQSIASTITQALTVNT
jgi:hypothetical protein